MTDKIFEEIDYKTVDKNLNQERERSRQWLRCALSDKE